MGVCIDMLNTPLHMCFKLHAHMCTDMSTNMDMRIEWRTDRCTYMRIER